jgi:hypothetical protein
MDVVELLADMLNLLRRLVVVVVVVARWWSSASWLVHGWFSFWGSSW